MDMNNSKGQSESKRSIIDNEDTIFHYTNINVAIENILYEKRLKFSRGANTNDPREYRKWIFEPHMDGTVCTSEEFFREWSEAEERVNQVILDYKFTCFCANKFLDREKSLNILEDDQTILPGYNRLRMWAQYGQGFHGVCIAFSAGSLQERLFELLGEKAIVHAKCVHYNKELEINDRALSDCEANDYMGKNKRKWATKFVRDHAERIFLSKHVDYQDESEYRIVAHDPKDLCEYVDITNCIGAVLLGDRTPQVYHGVVKDLCNDMNIECKKIEWQRGRLQLKDVEF